MDGRPERGSAAQHALRRQGAVLVLAMLLALLPACAVLHKGPALPSCSHVRGFYNPDIPLGAERVGSRLWIERRLIYTRSIGSVVRSVVARGADGQWQAGRLETFLPVENGLWKTTVATGLAGIHPYDVNFDARVWPEPRLTTVRIERRTAEIYLHAFGPGLGAYGLERTLRMVALRYRDAPETHWALCPVRW
ncbi:MAG: hypothetical protein GVY11_02375 [Gammaproteobacteria bacterium]|jgi:hypothetical protein|nr:hypothetical protein [Gammaproteobacteria bacterium]